MTEPPLTGPCPSDLALERLDADELAGAESEAVAGHVAQCGRCRSRLDAMEAQAAQYRRTDRARRARDAFARTDRRWRRTLVFAALAPFAAAAAAAAIVLPLRPLAPAAAPDEPARVQGRAPPRTVLEPRPDLAAPVRLRHVEVRGLTVEFGQGSLEAATDGARGPFTLRHTDVRAEVAGFVARVTVRQEYESPFADRVEAIYVFPLPDDAAVDDLTLKVGSRIIRGIVKRRDEARRDYEQAKHQGRRAALLDQERPNIFTQSVANIAAGERVEVSLSYVAPLRYDDGRFEFNFPMVVGPRYVPGRPVAGESQGLGASPDTDRVIDGSRVTPPVLAPGERSGRDIAVALAIDAGVPIADVDSVSHRLEMERPSMREARIRLAPDDRVPNKDLVVRWRVAGPELRSAILATRAERGGFFALLVQPEDREANPPIVPKEMVFVIDTSCSMTGLPLDAAKRAMRMAIEQMNPDDTFMLIDFADHASSFHTTPLLNTGQNVRRALAYLDALPAGGGTNQLDGIRAALELRPDPRRLRMVLLMTDGFIGNEVEIFAEAERLLGGARVFSFGVGTSVNHYLLDRLAEVGRGFAQYVRPDEDSRPAIERFVRRMARPLLTDVEIDWNGLRVSEVRPSRLPDLFDHQPLIVLGKYAEAGRARVTVHGRTGDRARATSIDIELPAREDRHGALATMWARAQIAALEKRQYGGERADVVRQITSLGLEHRLVTAYTSFVAVDETPVAAAGGPPRTVVEPTDMPELTTFGNKEKSNATLRGHGTGIGLGLGGSGTGGAPKRGKTITAEASGYSNPALAVATRPDDATVSLGGRVKNQRAGSAYGEVGGLGESVGGRDASADPALVVKHKSVVAKSASPAAPKPAAPGSEHASRESESLFGPGRSNRGPVPSGDEVRTTKKKSASPHAGLAGAALGDVGPRGTGVGGGGIGIGGLGTRGAGRGAGGYGTMSLAAKGLLKMVSPGDDELTVHGSLDKHQIAGIARKHTNEFRYCYEVALAALPEAASASGVSPDAFLADRRLVLRWTIGADGKVTDAAVREAPLTDTEASLHACLVARAQRWVFPRPAGGGLVVVTYPFHFKLTEPASAGPRTLLSPADVTQVVVSNKPAIAVCMQTHQRTKPGDHGTIVMRWTIANDGTTSAVGTDTSEYSGSELDRCLRSAIENWRFPTSTGPPQTIPFPFKF